MDHHSGKQPSFDCTYTASWDELTVPPGDTCATLLERAMRYLLRSTDSLPPGMHLSPSPISPRSGLADWQELFVGLSYMQVIAKYEPSLLLPYLDYLCPALVDACNNLRSSVCKNALLTVAHLCRGVRFAVNPYVAVLLPITITKSLSDKKFISDSAWLACSIIASKYLATENTLFQIMHCSQQHKNNAQYVSKCAQLIKLVVESLLVVPASPRSKDTHQDVASPCRNLCSTSPTSTVMTDDSTMSRQLGSRSGDSTFGHRERSQLLLSSSLSMSYGGPSSNSNHSGTPSQRFYPSTTQPQKGAALVGYNGRTAPERGQSGAYKHPAASTTRQPFLPAGEEDPRSLTIVQGGQRSASSPHLPQEGGDSISSPGNSPSSTGTHRRMNGSQMGTQPSVFVRGIGAILVSYLTERLPATKAAARQTIALLVAHYGGAHVQQCLLANGNVDVTSHYSSPLVLHSASKEVLLKAVAEAASPRGIPSNSPGGSSRFGHSGGYASGGLASSGNTPTGYIQNSPAFRRPQHLPQSAMMTTGLGKQAYQAGRSRGVGS